MSYYFPNGAGSETDLQNIAYSLQAVTASVPQNSAVVSTSASFAGTVGTAPSPGSNGTSVTFEQCSTSASLNPSLLVSGSKGPRGSVGSTGTSNNTCPAGTIRCTALEVSLSGAFPGYPSGINGIASSGSQYSIVCIEIPPGCTAGTTACPPYLPIATPSIP